MKKQLYILPYLLFVLIISGCEKESVLENKIEYIEYTVIRCELITDKAFNGLRITKTLPLEEEYTIEKAEIKGAYAYIKINNAQVIPLHYADSGMYKPINKLVPVENYTYELFIEIGDKKIYSKTKAPAVPKIRNSSYYNDSVVQASIIPRADEVYGCVWKIIGGNSTLIATANDFFYIYQDLNPSGFELINILSKNIPFVYRTSYYKSMLYAQVYAYDKPYADYYKSKNSNQVIENIFSQGGGPITWNVYGKNVIGLFIGSAISNEVKIQ